MLREGCRAPCAVQSTVLADRGRLYDADQSRAGGPDDGHDPTGDHLGGPYFQTGAEAIVPATRLTGHGYGGVVQLHFYLDDLFPHSIGKPISEWW